MTDRFVEQINDFVNISTDFILGRTDVVSKKDVGGRNLLPHFTSNRWNIDTTIIDDYYIESSPNDTFLAEIELELEPRTEYTFTFNVENGRYRFYNYPGGKITKTKTINYIDSTTGSVVNTFTTGGETSILLVIENSSRFNGTTRKAWGIKLEKGRGAL